MSGYKINIENKTTTNKYYRNVLNTTPQMQLVVMSIKNDIPMEKHTNITQFIKIEKGTGFIIIDDKKYKIKNGDCVVIPPNTLHYIKNTGKEPLKLYSIYTPPQHKNLHIDKIQL